MKEVTIYTDGACSGNPGAGGWGTILEYKGNRKELSGGSAETTNNRIESWKANGWRKKDKKPALNPELWDELLSEISRHEVTIEWIKGHAGHPENERCDELAVMESRKFI